MIVGPVPARHGQFNTLSRGRMPLFCPFDFPWHIGI